MSKEKIYLYPLSIRIWHGLNAIFCLFLIVTGLSMQFSNPRVPLIRFDLAVAIHNIFGILLALNYLVFFTVNLVSMNGMHYKIAPKGFVSRLMTQFRYYTKGVFKNESAPFPTNEELKFNPLQQMSYVVIMYFFVPVVVISGIGLLYPDLIPTNLLGISGLHLTDLFHIIAGFVISLFMFVHIYFCTFGKSPVSNFKSIMNGYHESH